MCIDILKNGFFFANSIVSYTLSSLCSLPKRIYYLKIKKDSNIDFYKCQELERECKNSFSLCQC